MINDLEDNLLEDQSLTEKAKYLMNQIGLESMTNQEESAETEFRATEGLFILEFFGWIFGL